MAESQDPHSEELPALADEGESQQLVGSTPPPSSQAAVPSAAAENAGALPAAELLRTASFSTVNSDIERLLEEQKAARAEKKRVQNELKNAQRRRRRLKYKARLLSQDDLLQVMALRRQESEAAQGSAGSERTAGSSSGGTPHLGPSRRRRAPSRSRSRSTQRSASPTPGAPAAAERPN